LRLPPSTIRVVAAVAVGGVALGGNAFRDDAELLHHGHCVEYTPVLSRAPVVAEADDVDELHVDVLPGRWNSHELTLMRARGSHAGDDLVTADESRGPSADPERHPGTS
jgi:hypothetical protein